MFLKKSLAQHFLRDRRILAKIADAAALSPAAVVLEVGPGEGGLTALLLSRTNKVIAVEKDDRLMPVLQQKFSREIAAEKMVLIHSDILHFDIAYYMLPATDYKVVANLPYYITGNFLRMFLQETAQQPSSMTLLLQKEVARRIVAANGRESLLSFSVKCYGEPKLIGIVKAGAFSPPPKVDSAILTIENISRDFFHSLGCHPRENGEPKTNLDSRVRGNDSEKRFFALLKAGFAHPRKLLASNLGLPPDALAARGIAAKARAENLSPEDWRHLASL